MEELKIWQSVNSCESYEDFLELLKTFDNGHGEIKGRTQMFNLEKMIEGARNYKLGLTSPNVVTREYGLRQQMMYLKYYNK